MYDLDTPLAALFLISFLAATLLPLGSELAVVATAALGEYPLLTLLLVASIGNILGSVSNYWLGRLALRFQDRDWFPVSRAALDKAQGRFAHWGQGVILLSWMPIIGDPITVAAGVMRMNFWRFLILVSLAKSLRYGVVIGAFDLVV